MSLQSDEPLSETLSHRETLDAASSAWRPSYWILAGVIPFFFYAFDAAMRASYPETQAPNVSLLAQLSIMLCFYALWTFVPWLVWFCVDRSVEMYGNDIKPAALRVGILGPCLCALHLLLLTWILRLMYAPPDGTLGDFLYSYGEAFLANAAVWLIAYAVAASCVLYRYFAPGRKVIQQSRFEVRQNGKIWSVPFDEIYWIKAAGNYAELHTDRGVMLVRKALTVIASELGGRSFIRSHRSALVNGKHVVAIKSHEDGSSYVIELSNNESAPLSRRHHNEFREALLTID